MGEFLGGLFSIIAILFLFYCAIAIPYYYLKKIYLFFFVDLKKTNENIIQEKEIIESPAAKKLNIQIKKIEKKRKKTKEEAQIIYEKKYKDLGLKNPGLNTSRSTLSSFHPWTNPIIPRIIHYDVENTKNRKIEKTPISSLLIELIENIHNPISDLKIAGLNGPSKKIHRIKLKINKDNKKYFDSSAGYNKVIAKGYSIDFRPKDWPYHSKLKNFDDFYQQQIDKGEETTSWDYFVENIINPIGKDLYKKYKNILDKHTYDNLSQLTLSPPHGQKISISIYLLTSSRDIVYYNQNYLTDLGIRNIKKISKELDKIFKENNVSLLNCYEDSIFREQALRLAENNFRKNNNIALIGEGWTSQTDLFNRLKSHFSLIEKEYSPKWIKPKRIDIYIKKYKVAIEYHGYQHYFPLPFFGGEKAFQKRQKDDRLKTNKCLKNKSSFIEWPYDVEINNKNVLKVKNYIEMNKDHIYEINVRDLIT